MNVVLVKFAKKYLVIRNLEVALASSKGETITKVAEQNKITKERCYQITAKLYRSFRGQNLELADQELSKYRWRSYRNPYFTQWLEEYKVKFLEAKENNKCF